MKIEELILVLELVRDLLELVTRPLDTLIQRLKKERNEDGSNKRVSKKQTSLP